MYGNGTNMGTGYGAPANPADHPQEHVWNGAHVRPPPNWGIAHPVPPNAWGVTNVVGHHAHCNTCGGHQPQVGPPAYYGASCQHGVSVVGGGLQWNPAAPTCSPHGLLGIPSSAASYGVMPRPGIPPPRPPPLSSGPSIPLGDTVVSKSKANSNKQKRGQQKGPKLYRTSADVDRQKKQIEDEQMTCVAVQRPKSKEELQDVLRWLEDRKRNFPTKENIKRKESEARLREERGELNYQQRSLTLQQVIEKQKEMGLDRIAGTNALLAAQGRGNGGKGRGQGRGRGRERGRRGKRKTDCLEDNGNEETVQHQEDKRQKSAPSSQNIPKRDPSLVEKLLYKEIRKDKSHLLQCVRFLVENNFLQDLGKQPLVYPDDAPRVQEGPQEPTGIDEIIESSSSEGSECDIKLDSNPMKGSLISSSTTSEGEGDD